MKNIVVEKSLKRDGLGKRKKYKVYRKMPTVVDADCCIACGACVDICPENVYDLGDVAIVARKEDCTDCGLCIDECPNECIDFE